MNKIHACNKKDLRMCGIELVIEEIFYSKETANRQLHDTCIEIGDALMEKVLVEYQDEEKVTSKFVDVSGGDYNMPKTTRKEKEQGYGIRSNHNLSEQNFALFSDALSLMGNALVYRAAAKGQSQHSNNFGHGVNAPVIGRTSKDVSAFC